MAASLSIEKYSDEKAIAGFSREYIIAADFLVLTSYCVGDKVVRFLLLLVVTLHLDSVTAFSLHGAGKNGMVRNGLRRLSGKQLPNLDRWAKAALCGSALLALVSTSPAAAIDALGHTDVAAVEAEASSEQVAIIQREVTDENVSEEQTHTESWSIAVTTKGKIAHMHMQTMEEEDSIRIAAYLEPTPKGKKYLAAKPLAFYHADQNYAIHDRSYNGFTLPFRLNWLAAEHSRTISEIHELLGMVAASERALVELGDSMYQNFSRLRVAENASYKFENLAEQTEIKFAGKRFFNRREVAGAIERRRGMLLNGRITYKERRQGVQLDQEVLNKSEAAYRTALARQPSSASVLTEPTLNFGVHAAGDGDFRALTEGLAHLKLARLLLAEEIMSLYKPFRLPYFFSAGMEENLMLTVFADDEKHRGIAFRYELHTTSIKHKRKFLFGQVDFDHNLNIKKMWVSLKPRGGLAGFAKLTSKPCHAGSEPPCPAPDFDQLR